RAETISTRPFPPTKNTTDGTRSSRTQRSRISATSSRNDFKRRSSSPPTCASGKDTGSGPRSERRLISAERLVRRMSDLVEAIEAEARSDFAKALGHYARLTESGSALDRVGIFQALARCNEKLGRLKDAGTWRRRAGQGYLARMDDA